MDPEGVEEGDMDGISEGMSEGVPEAMLVTIASSRRELLLVTVWLLRSLAFFDGMTIAHSTAVNAITTSASVFLVQAIVLVVV